MRCWEAVLKSREVAWLSRPRHTWGVSTKGNSSVEFLRVYACMGSYVVFQLINKNQRKFSLYVRFQAQFVN